MNQAAMSVIRKSGGTINRLRDDGYEVIEYANVLLMRDDHCIVRVIATQKKVAMPLVYPAVIDGVTYVVDGEPAEVLVITAPKAGPKRGEGPTKMDKCKEIFAANVGKPKAEVVALFVSEAGCTPAGANTYFLTCRKTLGVDLNCDREDNTPYRT